MAASDDKYGRIFDLLSIIDQVIVGIAKALDPQPDALESQRGIIQKSACHSPDSFNDSHEYN